MYIFYITEGGLELALFELNPNSSQIVFEGDKMPFLCRAALQESDMQMSWRRRGETLQEDVGSGILISTEYSRDNTVMTQRLVLEHLSMEHSGIWTCVVQTARGNDTKSVNIIVYSQNAVHCEPKVTATKRGTYSWPKMVTGVRADLPCQTGKASWYKGKAPPTAHYTCMDDGQWENLDVSQCQYASHMTRLLEQFAQVRND